jgi:hypothetical protein
MQDSIVLLSMTRKLHCSHNMIFGDAQLVYRWRVEVSLGKPAQQLSMIFDTGASSLAARSTLIAPNGPAYNPNDSSTATLVPGETYTNKYKSGHVGHGVVYNDTVSVGNLKLRMAFEVATSNNEDGSPSSDSDQGGDFGMDFAAGGMSNKPDPVPTFLEAAKSKLDQYLFTIDYDYAAQQGNVDFGFIDQSRYTGDIGYLPANGNGYWNVTFTGFAVGTGALQTHPWNTIIDSGTAGTHVPPYVVKAYCAQVDGGVYDSDALNCQYPCSGSLPRFVLGVGSHNAVIPGSYLKAASGSGTCVSKLGGATGMLVFGQSFIQAQFLVFDHGNKRVGFANKGA